MGNSPTQSQATGGFGPVGGQFQQPSISNLVGTTGSILQNNAPLGGGANITDLVRQVGQIRGIGAGAPQQPWQSGGSLPPWLRGVGGGYGSRGK